MADGGGMVSTKVYCFKKQNRKDVSFFGIPKTKASTPQMKLDMISVAFQRIVYMFFMAERSNSMI